MWNGMLCSGKPKQNKMITVGNSGHLHSRHMPRMPLEKGFGHLFCFLQSFEGHEIYFLPQFSIPIPHYFFPGTMQNLRSCLSSNLRLPMMLKSPDFHCNSHLGGFKVWIFLSLEHIRIPIWSITCNFLKAEKYAFSIDVLTHSHDLTGT